MKTKFFLLFILFGSTVYSQSVLTLDAGTSMGVLNGTDLCANIINPTGLLYGGGTICGNLVSVEPVAGNEIPREFVLMQNYPNPFNPMTNFEIQMPKSGFVKLAVFDITGKEVAVLINQELNAGVYSVDFDASNLSSGTYFYRMGADNFSEIKKMVLVK